MEDEIRKLLEGLPPETEAAVRQAILLFATKLIEAVTKNGDDSSAPRK